MAVLAELFLVLAGFDTSLEKDEFQHAAEYDIFERAHHFGQRFTVLRDACAIRDDAIANTIDSCVIQRYLDDIAELESETLAELSKLGRLPLGDTLFRSAELMDKSVDRWQRRFDLALQLLTELDPKTVSVAQSITEVSTVARLHAGFSDVYELCNKCVEALDQQWLNDLKVNLTTLGSEDDGAALDAHPSLTGTSGGKLLADACLSVQHLGSRHAGGIHGLVMDFLDVADENLRLVDSVAVPVTAQQLLPVLEQVSLNVLALVRSRIMHAKNVQAMLTFLRDILLFGSSAFADYFGAARGHTGEALDKLCDADPVFAADVYAHVDPMVQFNSESAELEVHWPLSLLFTADQCVVYCSIHSSFAATLSTLQSIGPGQGPVMHTYRLFLEMLWSEFQMSVDVAFAELRQAIDADRDLTVQSTQSRILRDLVRRLFLDSATVRAQLQRVIDHVGARSETAEPVRELAVTLSRLPHGPELPLRPFIEIKEA